MTHIWITHSCIFPQMGDSNLITWEYHGDGELENYQIFEVPKGTVVEDDMDMFIDDADGTPRKRTDTTFVLDGKKDDGSLLGHYLVDQDDETQKRVDVVRTCHHIRVPRKCFGNCMCNPNVIKQHDAPLYS